MSFKIILNNERLTETLISFIQLSAKLSSFEMIFYLIHRNISVSCGNKINLSLQVHCRNADLLYQID